MLRLFKVSTYYAGFLSQYYRLNAEILEKTYSEQYEHLMGQHHTWSDAYEIFLKNKGIEVFETVTNANPLLKSWAREHLAKRDIGGDILFQQIEYFKPDVIFFQDSFAYNGDYVKMVREKIRPKLIIGNVCAPFSSAKAKNLAVFDYLTTCSPKFLNEFTELGIKAYNIPHAFDPRILDKLNSKRHHRDFLFTGSIQAGAGFHNTRLEILEGLTYHGSVDLQAFTNLPNDDLLGFLKMKLAYSGMKFFETIGARGISKFITPFRKAENFTESPKRVRLSRELIKNIKPPVFGLDMFQTIQDSKITLNIHGDVAGDYAANIRMFEVTGVGSCLLTDRKLNMNDFFIEDKETVLYDNVQDCVEKVIWLLENPMKLNEIAKAGQKKTLEEHCLERRIELFHDILLKNI